MSAEDEMTTYRRADGDLIYDYGWVTDIDYFTEDDYAVEVIEEVWDRRTVRRIVVFPQALYHCEADLDCDEDAVGYAQVKGAWVQACALHGGEPRERIVEVVS